MAQLLAEQTQTAAGLILRLAWRQGLTREEIGLICGEEGYILRFKLVEWWNRLRHGLQF